MNYPNLVKKIAKEFGLDYNKGTYTYIILPVDETIIRSFLGGCPYKEYLKVCRSLKSEERAKKLGKFISSKIYRKELKGYSGTSMNLSNLEDETRALKYISNVPLRRKMERFYKRVKIKMKGKIINIVSHPKKYKKSIVDEMIVHELIHELINSNKIRPKYWKINEGLVTYLTYHAMKKDNLLAKESKSASGTFKVYIDNAIKCKNLFDNALRVKGKLSILKNIQKTRNNFH